MFRDAARCDRVSFLSLWAEMYTELQQYDCPYEADCDTMQDIARLFDSYVDGVLFGVVVLYDPPGEGVQGVLMIGEAGGVPTLRSKKRGKIGHIWGIFMHPDHRTKSVGKNLLRNAMKKLGEMHFDTLLSDIAIGNQPATDCAASIGCRQVSIVHTVSVGGEGHG